MSKQALQEHSAQAAMFLCSLPDDAAIRALACTSRTRHIVLLAAVELLAGKHRPSATEKRYRQTEELVRSFDSCDSDGLGALGGSLPGAQGGEAMEVLAGLGGEAEPVQDFVAMLMLDRQDTPLLSQAQKGIRQDEDLAWCAVFLLSALPDAAAVRVLTALSTPATKNSVLMAAAGILRGHQMRYLDSQAPSCAKGGAQSEESVAAAGSADALASWPPGQVPELLRPAVAFFERLYRELGPSGDDAQGPAAPRALPGGGRDASEATIGALLHHSARWCRSRRLEMMRRGGRQHADVIG